MLSLGLENINCSLVIQRVRPTKQTSSVLSSVDNGFKRIFLKERPTLFNEPKQSGYAITNVAGYFPTLPKNSIFNNISFYPSNWPDFNTLPLAGPVNTTNSTDISQNPETQRREVKMNTDDDGDNNRNNDNDVSMEMNESAESPDQRQRDRVMSEAEMERRKKLLRTMPQFNSNNNRSYDGRNERRFDNSGAILQHDSNEQKLRRAGILLNDHIDYNQLSKHITIPWSIVSIDNQAGLTEKDMKTLLQQHLFDGIQRQNVESSSSWNESLIMSSLIENMDIRDLTQKHFITEDEVQTFAEEVKKFINNILQ